MVTIFHEARLRDADGIGVVHVASWRETYAGILPDDFLQSLSAQQRASMWRGVLSERKVTEPWSIFVAENEREIVGFAACGKQRDQSLLERGFDCELGAIYVLQIHQREGIGSTLMRLMAQRLISDGYQAGTLWVLDRNACAVLLRTTWGRTDRQESRGIGRNFCHRARLCLE